MTKEGILQKNTDTLFFDRGTLLIENPNILSCSDEVRKKFTWDARVGLYRAPASLAKDLNQNLDSLSVEKNKTNEAFKNYCAQSKTLRPYQLEALKFWLNHKRGVIALPTGAGKTLVAIAAISQLKLRTLVLVPTRVLLWQWHDELQRAFPKTEIGCIGDGSFKFGDIVVCTFKSSEKFFQKHGGYFPFLILDEVHHFESLGCLQKLSLSAARFLLGLTATPSDSLGLQIQKIFHEKIGPILYQMGIKDLKGEYLADYEYKKIEVSLYPAQLKKYKEHIGYFKEYIAKFPKRNFSWASFQAMAVKEAEGRRALWALQKAKRFISFSPEKLHEILKILESDKGRCLIFTSDTQSAYEYSKQLLVPCISSEIGKKEREEILERFKSNEYRVLVSCRVLNEGIDIPDAEIAIFAGASRNAREYVQRLGRVLRLRNNKTACVFEMITKNTFEESSWRKIHHALD